MLLLCLDDGSGVSPRGGGWQVTQFNYLSKSQKRCQFSCYTYRLDAPRCKHIICLLYLTSHQKFLTYLLKTESPVGVFLSHQLSWYDLGFTYSILALVFPLLLGID